MGWVQLSFQARPKNTEPHAPLVPKAKLGHSNCVSHRVILPLVMAILGFLTIPWLGPKHTEPRATSVPKAKLGHTEPRATSVPKVKLGHTEPRATSVPKVKLGHSEPRATLVLYVSRLIRYWFSRFFKFTAFLVPSVEPAFLGIHDFLNPPPWIHMVDYRCRKETQ